MTTSRRSVDASRSPDLDATGRPWYFPPMQTIDGAALAAQLNAQTKADVAALDAAPGLAVLLVGEDAASKLYVGMKEKTAADIGIRTDIRALPATTTDEALEAIVRGWNADPAIDGILVQLPLPEGHDTDRVIAAIDPAKDADGLHPENRAAMERNEAAVVPPVHAAAMRLAAAAGFRPLHARGVVIAKSDAFTGPLAHLMRRAGMAVEVLHPDHVDWQMVKDADLVVTAVGKINFIKGPDVKPGTVLIDVGISKNSQGKTVGDVDAASCEGVDGWRSPVPGGVGPLTVASLLANVVALKKKRIAP